MMSIVLTLLGVSLLIVLHELGHYSVARAFGMRVDRFSIGFGPAIVSKQIGPTLWQVAAIPLGGFVQIHGMGSEEDTELDPAHSYKHKPVWQRALVILAGPAANWLVAAVFVALLAGSVGARQYHPEISTLGEVVPGGPAARAGLKAGDHITSANNTPLTTWQDLVDAVAAHPESTLHLSLERNGAPLTLDVIPRKDAQSDAGKIDILPSSTITQVNPIQAIATGAQTAWSMTSQYGSMVWGMITGKHAGQFSGLPGIVNMLSQQAKLGIARLTESLAWLSIGLCVLNLFPIPALDGGRFVFLLGEMVRGKPLSERAENWVHTVGFVLLLGLMLWTSVRDIIHLSLNK